jgi:hypothetical protein
MIADLQSMLKRLQKLFCILPQRALPEPLSSDRCDLSHQNSRILG